MLFSVRTDTSIAKYLLNTECDNLHLTQLYIQNMFCLITRVAHNTVKSFSRYVMCQ